jgi:hypothetical protein
MADITITINDANLADVRDTLYPRWGGPSEVGDPLAPVTNGQKVAFLKARVARFIKDEYKIAKGETAVVQSVDSVREAAKTAADSVDIN